MSHRVASRCPRASSSACSSGYSKISPFCVTQIEPSSLLIGCRPPARSTIDSRRAPIARPGSIWICSSSGPAVRDRAGHRQQPGRAELAAAVQIDRTGDAAHTGALPS